MPSVCACSGDVEVIFRQNSLSYPSHPLVASRGRRILVWAARIAVVCFEYCVRCVRRERSRVEVGAQDAASVPRTRGLWPDALLQLRRNGVVATRDRPGTLCISLASSGPTISSTQAVLCFWLDVADESGTGSGGTRDADSAAPSGSNGATCLEEAEREGERVGGGDVDARGEAGERDGEGGRVSAPRTHIPHPHLTQ